MPAEGGTADEPLTLLKRIPALDVESALDAMSGFEDIYIDTVKLTMRLLPERVKKMDTFITIDIEAFTVEVHGLKSVLRNIGAGALGNTASQLENAGIDKNTEYLNEHYPPFRVELLALNELLIQAVQPKKAEPTKAADKSGLVKALAEARALAEGYDRDGALEVLTPCAQCSYDEETDEAVQKIINALEAFDCEEALRIMEVVSP
ncbi:MAG: hypothetical protein FWG87_06345 [Defluviitaleaceae bacterium]|nr:hypothetical protein [Defluviitaleaceae bacterium]